MKTIFIISVFLISTSLHYGQSSVVYGASTSLYIGTESDICAGTISIRGTFSGDGTFCNEPVGVETGDDTGIPKDYSLSQNFPNPFNPVTIINFELPENKFVTLKVYDILGNEIATLVNENRPAGSYEINFDASKLPSGVYYYRLSSGSFVETKKMLLLK